MIVYDWRQISIAAAGGAVSSAEHFVFTVANRAGWTLVRALVSLQLYEKVNVTNFPPDAATPWAIGVYHALNAVGNDLQPQIYDVETDWIAWGAPEWFTDWGIITGTQSDLSYHAHLQVDVHSQRKLLQDNATVTIAYGPVTGNAPPNPNARNRAASLSGGIRLLYRVDTGPVTTTRTPQGEELGEGPGFIAAQGFHVKHPTKAKRANRSMMEAPKWWDVTSGEA